MPVDQNRLDAFLGRALTDMGGAMSATLILIGDQLGLYRALARKPMNASELASTTGTSERYVREWLGNQAAGGYVDYDADSDRYSLTPEQALCMADPDGPVDVPGAYSIVEAAFHAMERTKQNFRSGEGMEWGEHHACLFHGTERFFRAGYNAHLLHEWLPALAGVVEKLEAGGKAADVGCGHGASTLLLAQAFPGSTFVGYDYHAPSIEVARERAAAAGIANARFEVAEAGDYPEGGFDLVAFFDCLHDMADPVGAARHACRALDPDGTCMLVEPFAGDTVASKIRSGACITAPPRRSACRCRWRATDRRLAPRPARPGSARSCAKRGSAASGAPPRRPSTSCSKHVPDPGESRMRRYLIEREIPPAVTAE